MWQEKQKNLKNLDDDVILGNCDVIVIFWIIVNLEQQNWKISNTTFILLLWVKVPFLQKNVEFLQKKWKKIKNKKYCNGQELWRSWH